MTDGTIISDLPAASSVSGNDLTVVVQGGVTRKATLSLFGPSLGVIVVANITALRLVDVSEAGLVFMEGYATAGDGGGGWWYYVEGDTTSADNTGTIVVATGGARLYRDYDGAIDTRWWGFDAAALIAAYAAMGNVEYTVVGDVVVGENVVIDGDGSTWNLAGANLIVGADDITVFDVTGNNNRIRDFRITNPGGYSVSDNSVFPKAMGIQLYNHALGNDIGPGTIEGLINGVLNPGFDPAAPTSGNHVHDLSISILPHNFGAYDGWPNDGLVSFNGTYGFTADTVTVVIYTGPGIFTNLTGTAYTYARAGASFDVGCVGAKGSTIVVGQGFSTSLYNDNEGNTYDTCTAFPGYNSTVALANGKLSHSIVKAPTSTAGTSLNAPVTVVGGACLEDNEITGGSASVVLVSILNIGTDPITSRGNRFRGTYAHGFSGNIPGSFESEGDEFGGTCAGRLYNVGMISATSSFVIANQKKAAGLTFLFGLYASPVYNAAIANSDMGDYSLGGAGMVFLGGSTNLRIAGTDLSTTHAADTSILVSNGAVVPDMTVTGNNMKGPTTAFVINSAAASISTAASSTTAAQIVVANRNNSTGTF